MSASGPINILLVAAGGTLGCLLRYYVQEIDLFHTDKYYFTLGINITGCLVMGIVWAICSHLGVSQGWRLFLMTGLLGGYTTYSSFTLDALLLLQSRMTLRFLFYVSVTFFGGLAACAAGMSATGKILKML